MVAKLRLRINLLFVACHGPTTSGLIAECTVDSTCKRLLFPGKSVATNVVEYPERTGMFEFSNIMDTYEQTFKLGFFDSETESPLGFAVLNGNHGIETCKIQGMGECCVNVTWSDENESDDLFIEEEEEPMELEICLKPHHPPHKAAVDKNSEQYWLAFQYCEMEVCSATFSNLRTPTFPATIDTFKIISTPRSAKEYCKHTPLVVRVHSNKRGVLAIAVVQAVPTAKVPFYSWTGCSNVGEFIAEFRVYRAEDEPHQEEEEKVILAAPAVRKPSPPSSPPPPPPPPPPLQHMPVHSFDGKQGFESEFREFIQLKQSLELQEREGLKKLAEVKQTQERLRELEQEVKRTMDLLNKREKQQALRERDFQNQIARERKLVSNAKHRLEQEREELEKQFRLTESMQLRKLHLQVRNLQEEKRLLQHDLERARMDSNSVKNRLQEELEVSKSKDDRINKLKQELKRTMQGEVVYQQQQPPPPPLQRQPVANPNMPPPTTQTKTQFTPPSQMTATEKLHFLVEAKNQLQRTNPDLPELWRQFDAQIETARRAAYKEQHRV